MMKRLAQVILPLAAALCMAQGAAPPAGELNLNAAVAPYISEDTVLVGHADLSRIDMAQIDTFVTSLLDAASVPANSPMRREYGMGRIAAGGFLDRLKEFGVRHVFVVMAMEDVYPGMSGPAVLFRVDSAAAAPNRGGPEALADFLKGLTGSPETVAIIGQMTAIAPAPATLGRLQKLQAMKAAERPELALNNTAPVEVMAALTASQKRAFSELVPALPRELGGGSTGAYVQNLRHVRLSMMLPPQPRVALEIAHGAGAGGADGNWMELATKVRDALLADPGFNREVDRPEMGGPAGGQKIRALLREVLTPVSGTGEMGGGRLNFAMTEPQIRTFAQIVLGPALVQAQTSALRTATAARVRELIMGAIIYSSEHGNQWPATMEDAGRYLKQPVEAAMKNPSDPQGRAFVYRSPGDMTKIKNPSQTAVMWEQSDSPDGIMIGFADGHVEFVRRAAVEQYVKPPLP